MAEEKYISGFCPHCNFRIDYSEKDQVVQCPACDNNVPVSSILKSLDVKAAQRKNETNIQLFQSINNPESALAYLENFFESFDWDEYNQTSTILIHSIEVMVEKQKVTNAATGNTWKLEFESIIVPLMHKIDGLKSLEKEMAEKYNPIDDTDIYSAYDNYLRISRNLLANKDELFKTLLLDIKYAEKYGLESNQVDEMKQRLVILNDMYESIKLVDSPQEIPCVAKKINDIEQKVVNELAAKGINAVEVYNNALSLYLHNNDKTLALNEFKKIKYYKDSSEYIYEINRLFNFNNELLEIGGLKFTTFADRDKAINLDESSASEDENSSVSNNDNDDAKYLSASQKGHTFSLYEIIDGKPSKKPTVIGISKIIAIYGSNLYYIKNNISICVFNVFTQIEETLDKGQPNDYRDINNEFAIYLSEDKSKFVIRKKLTVLIDEPGCFQKLFGKKAKEIKNNNNYSIRLIDMEHATCSTLVHEVIDILDYFENKLFYTYSSNPNDDKQEFRMCDITTGVSESILDVNLVIHTVHNNKIIYSKLTPNNYNKDLYCMDLESRNNLLLEDNIFNYFGIIDNKIYYTIGNSKHEPLLSINFDGTGRTEILHGVIDVLFVRAGWMYVLKGYGINKALVKISTDGSRRITLCSAISKVVEFVDGYVYYLDTHGDLRVVRNDGKDDCLLVESVDDRSIVTDSEKIYFLRKELVGKNYGYSLYSLKVENNELKKLSFDVLAIEEYDESCILLSKTEKVKYRITEVIEKKVSALFAIILSILSVILFIIYLDDEDFLTYLIICVLACIVSWIAFGVKKGKNNDQINSFEKVYELRKYYSYNKEFNEYTPILTIGDPDLEEIYNKNAPKNVTYSFSQVPIENKYYRKNIVKAGANFAEKHQEFVNQQNSKK